MAKGKTVVNALELLQSFTKPSVWPYNKDSMRHPYVAPYAM